MQLNPYVTGGSINISPLRGEEQTSHLVGDLTSEVLPVCDLDHANHRLKSVPPRACGRSVHRISFRMDRSNCIRGTELRRVAARSRRSRFRPERRRSGHRTLCPPVVPCRNACSEFCSRQTHRAGSGWASRLVEASTFREMRCRK